MPYLTLKQDDILGSREVRFISRQETNYPQLMRLAMDFEMCILQVQRRAFSHISKRYLPIAPAFILVGRDYLLDHKCYSPALESLRDLDQFARDHHVDILHDYLFGQAAETA
jgi:hypothetical protein